MVGGKGVERKRKERVQIAACNRWLPSGDQKFNQHGTVYEKDSEVQRRK